MTRSTRSLSNLSNLAYLAYLALAVMACSTPPQRPATHVPRASDHLEAAREQDQQAHDLAAYPDLRHDGTGRVHAMPIGPGTWSRHWDTATDHERLARIHRSAAALIEAEYQEACGDRPYTQVSVSPLQRHGIGGTPTADGVIVYLSPDAGPPDQLMAELRCHRAWMMLGPSGRNGMDDCPLDLDGVQIGAVGDSHGIALVITVRDRALIEELQRRTGIDLEVAARHK